MKITIELRKEWQFGNAPLLMAYIRTEYNGEILEKRELLETDYFEAVFDRAFEKAKYEIKNKWFEQKKQKNRRADE